MQTSVAGELAQWVKILAVVPEDPSSIPCMHMVIPDHL